MTHRVNAFRHCEVFFFLSFDWAICRSLHASVRRLTFPSRDLWSLAPPRTAGQALHYNMAASAAALEKLYLTDFGGLMPSNVCVNSDAWLGLAPISHEETAFQRLVENAERLSRLGAKGEREEDFYLPANFVSGFPIVEGDEKIFPGIRSPSELDKTKTLSLLMWGSPHPNSSSSVSDWHGASCVSSEYKTQAFESMAWLCPSGVVAMPFPRKYQVEFYQPMHDENSQNRVLIVAKMYSRKYVPMSSGAGLRWSVPDVTKEDVMIAMLVPPRLMRHVVWMEEGAVDFGKTVLNFLSALPTNEFGAALGVYDCSLEMELVLALEEQE